MKKLLVVLLAIAAMGVPAYLWVAGSIFGVDDEHPLGRFELIDGWLQEKGFTKSKPTAGEPMGEMGEQLGLDLDGVEVITYEHEYKERTMGGRSSRVILLRDKAGAVRGVASMFWSGREDMRDPTCRGEALLGTLWLEITGKKAVFEEKMNGKGRFARMERVAQFTKGRARGTWSKRYESNGDERTIWDAVALVVGGGPAR